MLYGLILILSYFVNSIILKYKISTTTTNARTMHAPIGLEVLKAMDLKKMILGKEEVLNNSMHVCVF